MAPTRVRAKYWICTLNNFTVVEEADLKSSLDDDERVVYAVYQHERGESNTDHLQLFVCVGSSISLVQCKRLLGSQRWHCERARAPTEAEAYCRKTDSRVNGPWTVGELPDDFDGQGARRDIEAERDAILQGMYPGGRDFAMAFPAGVVARSRGNLQLYNQVHGQARTTRPEIIIYWGASGTGKTYKACNDHPGEKYFKPPGKWWDGYHHQAVTVYNDFCPTAWDFGWNEFKRLSDWADVNYEAKGSSVRFNSPKVIFTANSDPRTWWAMDRDQASEQEVWDNRNITVIHCVERYVAGN